MTLWLVSFSASLLVVASAIIALFFPSLRPTAKWAVGAGASCLVVSVLMFGLSSVRDDRQGREPGFLSRIKVDANPTGVADASGRKQEEAGARRGGAAATAEVAEAERRAKAAEVEEAQARRGSARAKADEAEARRRAETAKAEELEARRQAAIAKLDEAEARRRAETSKAEQANAIPQTEKAEAEEADLVRRADAARAEEAEATRRAEVDKAAEAEAPQRGELAKTEEAEARRRAETAKPGKGKARRRSKTAQAQEAEVKRQAGTVIPREMAIIRKSGMQKQCRRGRASQLLPDVRWASVRQDPTSQPPPFLFLFQAATGPTDQNYTNISHSPARADHLRPGRPAPAARRETRRSGSARTVSRSGW